MYPVLVRTVPIDDTALMGAMISTDTTMPNDWIASIFFQMFEIISGCHY